MSMLTVNGWNSIPGLVHGFLSRLSTAATVDSTSPDWSTQLEAHGVPRLTVVTARQVHGTRICNAASLPASPPEADGLVTTTRGLAVGIKTADCVPVLFVAPPALFAAAVHAGWRGAVAGIVPEAVSTAVSNAAVTPAALRVAIGPAVGPCCYEVGPEVRVAFEKRYGSGWTAPVFSTPGPRPHLDLRLFVRRQLEAAGVSPSAIEIVGPCTACDRTYASYRRDGQGAGRQLSFVGWL